MVTLSSCTYLDILSAMKINIYLKNIKIENNVNLNKRKFCHKKVEKSKLMWYNTTS